MRVMVIVKATKDSEAGVMPGVELLEEMGKFNELLAQAGIMLEGAGLKPTSQGARVRFSGRNRVVTRGPFAETHEIVAGYWVWKVDSLDEAIEWVKRCPNPMLEDSEIEIRPFFEAEDFGEAYSTDLREQAATTTAIRLGLNSPRFQEGPAWNLVGLNRAYTMETRVAIPEHWVEFTKKAMSIPGLKVDTYFGVSWNSQPDCSFEYLTGFVSEEGVTYPDEWTSLPLEARRYAVFPHTKHVSALPQTLSTIWKEWVADCELEISNGPCLELYTKEFDPSTGMGGMELWIPLK